MWHNIWVEVKKRHGALPTMQDVLTSTLTKIEDIFWGFFTNFTKLDKCWKLRFSNYVMTWNFCDKFTSRFWCAQISWQLNSAIWGEFCILNHFNFAFLSNKQLVSFRAMLLEHVLEFSKTTLSKGHQGYNNVNTNKDATAGLYVNSNVMRVT